MNKQIELEQLDRAIKDGEIRLRTVKINIDTLSRDIDILVKIESDLIDNIKFLKQNKIVAMAGEYKKAKDSLARTVIRLIGLMNDREHFRKAAKNVEEMIEKAKSDIEKIRLEGDNNVVRGTFGRKKDG